MCCELVFSSGALVLVGEWDCRRLGRPRMKCLPRSLEMKDARKTEAYLSVYPGTFRSTKICPLGKRIT